MTKSIAIPQWAVTLGSIGAAVFGALIGVASAAWSARSMVDAQTAAIASLQQTLDQKVEPAILEVTDHAHQIAGHDTRITVIEKTCCAGPLARTSIGSAP